MYTIEIKENISSAIDNLIAAKYALEQGNSERSMALSSIASVEIQISQTMILFNMYDKAY